MSESVNSGWKECKLGEVGVVVTGKTPSSKNPDDLGNDIPFVTPTDYRNYHKEVSFSDRFLSSIGANKLKSKILPPKSVMVTCIGSDMGKVAINTIPVITNQQINSIISDIKMVDPDFLYYKLVESYDVLRSYGLAGTAVPIVNKTDFEGIEILLPPLPEQRAIAGVLSSLDDKIDLLHRQNKTLESIAEALWHKMFIEEAKEEWEKINLNEIAELQRGISYNGNQLGENGNGTPMHNLNSIDINGSYKYEGIKFYTGVVKEKQKLKAGDLLVINTDITQENRIIGRPILVPGIFTESTFTHHLYSVTLQSDKFSKIYLFFLLRHRDYRETLASSANGTTVSMLSKEAICSLEIRIPPVEKRKEFEEIAAVILDKQSFNHNQIKILTLSRDILLPKLMSGEVRVRL